MTEPPPAPDPAIAAYAERRELEYEEVGSVRGTTPALASAPNRACSVARGELAPGLDGELFHLDSGESEGATAILTRIPETIAYATTISCRDRRHAGRRPAKYPTEKWEEVRLESTAFAERFEVLVLRGQHQGWIRELFSPQLIDWLAADVPAGLLFELNEGWLAILVPGRLDGVDGVASFCETAAALKDRIRAEAIEEGDAPNLFRATEGTMRTDAAVAQVTWKEPPESVTEAAAAYLKVAERKPSVLARAALWAVAGAVLAGAFGWLLGGPFGALAAGAFGLLGGFTLSRPLLAGNYLFEGGLSVTWTGLQAFNREYASSRGLERQKLFRFHHDHRDFPVPGTAESVQAGEVPVAGVRGLFVMLSDSAELRATGSHGMTHADGRPGSYDALVVDLSPRPSEEAVSGLDSPAGYSVQLTPSGSLVVSRPIDGNLTRTAEGCDEFRRTAGELIAHLSA